MTNKYIAYFVIFDDEQKVIAHGNVSHECGDGASAQQTLEHIQGAINDYLTSNNIPFNGTAIKSVSKL